MSTTVIGFLGSTLDASKFGTSRWSKWRPSVGLCMHDDLRVDRFILLHGTPHRRLAEYIAEDIADVSPETKVTPHLIDFTDPWDFEEVYGKLLDFARAFFKRDESGAENQWLREFTPIFGATPAGGESSICVSLAMIVP